MHDVFFWSHVSFCPSTCLGQMYPPEQPQQAQNVRDAQKISLCHAVRSSNKSMYTCESLRITARQSFIEKDSEKWLKKGNKNSNVFFQHRAPDHLQRRSGLQVEVVQTCISESRTEFGVRSVDMSFLVRRRHGGRSMCRVRPSFSSCCGPLLLRVWSTCWREPSREAARLHEDGWKDSHWFTDAWKETLSWHFPRGLQILSFIAAEALKQSVDWLYSGFIKTLRDYEELDGVTQQSDPFRNMTGADGLCWTHSCTLLLILHSDCMWLCCSLSDKCFPKLMLGSHYRSLNTKWGSWKDLHKL